MGIVDILSPLLRHPMLGIGLACLAVVAVLMIPMYFRSRRPRRGTIEWIKRLDQPHFLPMKQYEIQFVDFVWAVLCGLSAAFLRFAYCFFSLRVLGGKPGVELLRAILPESLALVVTGAVLALVLYFIHRLIFGSVMNAILMAVTGGLILSLNPAMVPFAAALLCFYCWMTAPYEAPLFPRAIFFPLALGLLAWAVVCCPAMAWFLPFFAAAYPVIQFFRWKNGLPAFRKRKLLFSLLLLIPSVLIFALVFSLAYANQEGRLASQGLPLLTDADFYRSMLAGVAAEAASLISPLRLAETAQTGDVICAMLGLTALVPLLHGVFRLRNSRCLCLLLMLPFALAACLVSSVWLPLSMLFLLITGWTWSTYCKRGYGFYGVICSVVTCVLYFTENILY